MPKVVEVVVHLRATVVLEMLVVVVGVSVVLPVCAREESRTRMLPREHRAAPTDRNGENPARAQARGTRALIRFHFL